MVLDMKYPEDEGCHGQLQKTQVHIHVAVVGRVARNQQPNSDNLHVNYYRGWY